MRRGEGDYIDERLRDRDKRWREEGQEEAVRERGRTREEGGGEGEGKN